MEYNVGNFKSTVCSTRLDQAYEWPHLLKNVHVGEEHLPQIGGAREDLARSREHRKGDSMALAADESMGKPGVAMVLQAARGGGAAGDSQQQEDFREPGAPGKRAATGLPLSTYARPGIEVSACDQTVGRGPAAFPARLPQHLIHQVPKQRYGKFLSHHVWQKIL